MAEFDVVAAVSRTLEERLTAGLLELGGTTPPHAQVHDLVEEPATDPATLTLFLYDIVQDPSVRNRPASTRVVNDQAPATAARKTRAAASLSTCVPLRRSGSRRRSRPTT
jgi:hypothetical protein